MILGQSCTNSNGVYLSYTDCRAGYLRVGDPSLRIVRREEFTNLPIRYHRSMYDARNGVYPAIDDSQATRAIPELSVPENFDALVEGLAEVLSQPMSVSSDDRARELGDRVFAELGDDRAGEVGDDLHHSAGEVGDDLDHRAGYVGDDLDDRAREVD